jgi:uncharacterized phage infection (PIP) family protein YhgE
MSDEANELAALIERRNKELGAKISELLSEQEKLQQRISQLLGDKSAAAKQRRIELRDARREAGEMIGLLATERTDLLDDLPVIVDAAGELDVQAKKLAKDAVLIEEVTERVLRAAKKIAQAEKLLVKIASLAKPLLI